MAQAVEEYVARGFFHSHAASLDCTLGEPFGGKRIRALVFLPGANFDLPRKQLAEAAFLKRRGDKDRRAVARQEESQNPFARPPVDACEVSERGSRGDKKRVKDRLRFSHQLLSLRDACLEFA